MKNEARWLWFAVAGLVLLADLISKQIVIYTLEYSEQIPLLPCLSLTYVENHGAAFSFLSEMGGWQRWLFSGLAILISILLVQWLRRIPASERLLSFAIALVLGGAIGNLVDRIVYGSVLDFILLYYRSWSWPVFNIADSAITLGAAILIVLLVFCKEKRAWFL